MRLPGRAWPADECCRPAYLGLGIESLRKRRDRAVAALAECRLCPRDCGADRLSGKWSACKTGRYAVVSSAFRDQPGGASPTSGVREPA